MAQAKRQETDGSQASSELGKSGEQLISLITELFSDGPDIEVGSELDEVTLTIEPNSIPDVCKVLKEDIRFGFDYLRCLCVVDYIERLEINYHLFSLTKRHKMVVKSNVVPENPNVPSVIDVWRGANWYERESRDLFGIVFVNHPNLVPLLLYEGFEGFPGRKDFPFHDYDEW